MPQAAKYILLAVLTVVGSACGTQASKPNNTTNNSVGISSLPEKPLSQFPSPASAALGSLSSHTPVPLAAPLSIPADLSAKITSTKLRYAVSLYRCQLQLPLNSPEIGNPPGCSGLASYVGEFGGTRYPTAGAARLGLSTLQEQPTRVCGPNSNSTQQVRLVRGVRGVLTSSKGVFGYCEMRFELNGWTILISGNVTLHSVAEAKQQGSRVVDLMTKVRMPGKNGVVVIQIAGDGNHTWLTWTIGQNLYAVSEYHSISAAFAMASSMTWVSSVPSHKSAQ